MMTIFNDGVLEARLYSNQWVFVRWIQNMHGRLQKRLIRDLNLIEKLILANRWHGWFTESEINHSNFHKLLIKFGAMPREIIGEFQQFIKPILGQGDLHVRR